MVGSQFLSPQWGETKEICFSKPNTDLCCVIRDILKTPSLERKKNKDLVFESRWTIAHQAGLSIGFSRQESWSELPCMPLPRGYF